MQAEVHDDHIDRDVLEVSLTGQMLLEHPLLNKGTSFPEDERREFHLLGLLPQHVAPLEVQLARTYENYCLQRRRPGALYLPGIPTRPQRNTLLPLAF